MMITFVIAIFVLYAVVMWRYRRQGDMITGSLITAMILCLIEDVMGQKVCIALISGWWVSAWISVPILILFLASVIYDLERKRRQKKQVSLRDTLKKQWGTQIVNPKQSSSKES